MTGGRHSLNRTDEPFGRPLSTCELVANLTIHERWIAWDEGRSFRYEGSGLPLVKRASNFWSVHPEGERRSLLTTKAEVELKGGLLGKLLEPIMVAAFRRMAPNSLAAFKYLVENGRPYEGKHSELPRVPATCYGHAIRVADPPNDPGRATQSLEARPKQFDYFGDRDWGSGCNLSRRCCEIDRQGAATGPARPTNAPSIPMSSSSRISVSPTRRSYLCRYEAIDAHDVSDLNPLQGGAACVS